MSEEKHVRSICFASDYVCMLNLGVDRQNATQSIIQCNQRSIIWKDVYSALQGKIKNEVPMKWEVYMIQRDMSVTRAYNKWTK